MKKFCLSLLIIGLTVFAFADEYKVAMSDSLSIGTSRAYECVATMAHLAGFEEFNQVDYTGFVAEYDIYFSDYMNNPKVKKSISHFKKLRNTRGFSYDAIGTAGTYLSSDCHSYRTDNATLKKYMDPRCGDLKKLLKAVSTFYDETNFEEFYDAHRSLYSNLAQSYFTNFKSLQNSIDAVKSYYKVEDCKVFISSSILNYYNNFGCSFHDGDSMSFEPKYSANSYDESLLVHELSHPYTMPLIDVLLKNKEIKKYFKSVYTGTKADYMKSIAYGNAYGYVNELINRSCEVCVLQSYADPAYTKADLVGNKLQRFDEITEIVEMLQDYNTGDYASLMDYVPVLEQKLVEFIRANPANKKAEEKISSVTLFGKNYDVTFCGTQDLQGFKQYDHRSFWRVENGAEAFEDFAGAWDYLPFSNYPCEVQVGDVFRIYYEFADGTSQVKYYKCFGDDINTEDPSTVLIWIE